ncbi:hypothetical protein ACWF0M_25550 [Kribbella sp. NPDC055110]
MGHLLYRTMSGMGERAAVLGELADVVLAVGRAHPVRVGVDGCSAAGKTTLADELAEVLRGRGGRDVVRVGLDYFKRAPELRTAYPIGSAESPGEQLYVDQVRPGERAQLLINNEDPANPTLTRR